MSNIGRNNLGRITSRVKEVLDTKEDISKFIFILVAK